MLLPITLLALPSPPFAPPIPPRPPVDMSALHELGFAKPELLKHTWRNRNVATRTLDASTSNSIQWHEMGFVRELRDTWWSSKEELPLMTGIPIRPSHVRARGLHKKAHFPDLSSESMDSILQPRRATKPSETSRRQTVRISRTP